MKLRVLFALALLPGLFAGIVAAHGNPDGSFNESDPVTCGGGETYSSNVMTLNQITNADPSKDRKKTLYVVFAQADATNPGKYSDADKTSPFSIWKEENNLLNLQPTAYECKFSDGHVWGYDSCNPPTTVPPTPKCTTPPDPQPTAEQRAAHPEYERIPADRKLTSPIP